MSKEIIHNLSGSDHMFGGDLSAVVRFLQPTLQKYNRDKEEVFNLTNNLYNISDILFTSYEAWTELTDFGQRYKLSTNILANIDNTGFLYLYETEFSLFMQFNITMQFNFKSLVVILDKIDSTGALPNCYDFDQVRNQNHHITPLSIILQGSICLPSEVWGTKPGLGHVVVSALEFYNGDSLIFPAFKTNPQSNLSSIISLSVDNNSKVELPLDGEPIRIRFNQVTPYECDIK